MTQEQDTQPHATAPESPPEIRLDETVLRPLLPLCEQLAEALEYCAASQRAYAGTPARTLEECIARYSPWMSAQLAAAQVREAFARLGLELERRRGVVSGVGVGEVYGLLSLLPQMLEEGSKSPPSCLDQLSAQARLAVDGIRQRLTMATASNTPIEKRWLPMMQAVKKAATISGLSVNFSSLSRFARAWGVEVRPAQLPGNHKQEVEYGSLIAVLARRSCAERPEDEEPPAGAHDEAIKKAKTEKKKKRGNLD